VELAQYRFQKRTMSVSSVEPPGFGTTDYFVWEHPGKR
jgi:hypothetical protein